MPGQADPGTAEGGDVLGGGLQILLERGEAAAGVEIDQEAGAVAEVDHLGDGAGGGGVPGLVGDGGLLQHADLLRADAVGAVGAQDAPGGLAAEQVGGADERGDEGRRGTFVDLGGCADLFEAALAEDGDAVAHRQGLLLVVGDEDERDADLALQRLEFQLHLLAQFQVQGAEGFVEQQDAGAADQGAGERDPLALAARELGGPPGAVALQADLGERLTGLPQPLGLGHLADLQGVGDVLLHRHVREERVVLEDGVDVAFEGREAGDLLPGQFDPALGGRLEPGDQTQHRGLAGAGRAEHGEELPVAYLQVDAVHGDRLPERLAQALQSDRPSLHAGTLLALMNVGRKHMKS